MRVFARESRRHRVHKNGVAGASDAIAHRRSNKRVFYRGCLQREIVDFNWIVRPYRESILDRKALQLSPGLIACKNCTWGAIPEPTGVVGMCVREENGIWVKLHSAL